MYRIGTSTELRKRYVKMTGWQDKNTPASEKHHYLTCVRPYVESFTKDD